MIRQSIISRARRFLMVAGAVIVGATALANEGTSSPIFIYVQPELSSFWHTVAGNSLTVAVDLPSGASSAALTVTGPNYSETYSNLTGPNFTFTLPSVETYQQESVYKLTLTFDNSDVYTAKMAVLKTSAEGNTATAKCVLPLNSSAWTHVKQQATLPVPYGTTSLKVNGVEMLEADTCTGAQGWLFQTVGGAVSLELVQAGSVYLADLTGSRGIVISFR